MDPNEIYENAKMDNHTNSHTMRFNFMQHYPLFKYSTRTLRFNSPLLSIQPIFPIRIHWSTKVLKADDDLINLLEYLQLQCTRQVSTYFKWYNQPIIEYYLPSNQIFMDSNTYNNSPYYAPMKKQFVDDTTVKLRYESRTKNHKKYIIADFGKSVTVKHLSIYVEVIKPYKYIRQDIRPDNIPKGALHAELCGVIASYGYGRTKRLVPKMFKTKKEKKEDSTPQICVKPSKIELKPLSPFKQFKLSYKNKQGKWCILGILNAPNRCEQLIDLTQYSLTTQYIKIEPLNYVPSPLLEIYYQFYGAEQPKYATTYSSDVKCKGDVTTYANALKKQVTKENEYRVQMARSFKRISDFTDAQLNLHKRIKKYKRGGKWTGRSSQEYCDMDACLRMREYRGDRQNKRYSMHNYIKNEYEDWLANL
jgi:hypothetical protein